MVLRRYDPPARRDRTSGRKPSRPRGSAPSRLAAWTRRRAGGRRPCRRRASPTRTAASWPIRSSPGDRCSAARPARAPRSDSAASCASCTASTQPPSRSSSPPRRPSRARGGRARRPARPRRSPAGRRARSSRRHVLAHADLRAEHILEAAGRITGVIDWSDAAVTDPALDFAASTRLRRGLLAAALDAYGGIEDAAMIDRVLRLLRRASGPGRGRPSTSARPSQRRGRSGR